MSDPAAAASTAPEPARTQPTERRSPRKPDQTAAAAARSSGSENPAWTTSRPTAYAITTSTPATIAAIPSREAVRRRSGAIASAAAAAATVRPRRSSASTRTRSPRRARSPVTPPTLRFRTGTLPVSSSWAASFGRIVCSASPATVPTSTSVSVIVSWSRSNTARWTSSAALWKRLANVPPPTIPDTAEMMSGRAASSSDRFARTRRSVTRSATSVRTLESRSVAVARLANPSESTSARRA
jgi:hypothetical protein